MAFYNYSSNECILTLNTARICGTNSLDTSTKISKIGYTYNNPGSIILVNKNEVFTALATSSLIHHPRNAPIIASNENYLSPQVLHEIIRLNPKEYDGVDVLLVGNLSKAISLQLNSMGLKTFHINGSNHYKIACRIFDYAKEVNNILIVSGENYTEGLPAAYWSVHMGDPILFVKKDEIPSCTLDKIKKTPNANIYIIGSTKTVSQSVQESLQDLSNINFIDRIEGNTPYELAVNFAKYKSPKGEFGWGKTNRDGHAFTFATLSSAIDIVCGSFFAHMGKHTPLLLVKESSIPTIVTEYINSIKPSKTIKPHPPFMQGWILGCFEALWFNTQIQIEQLLSIDHH